MTIDGDRPAGGNGNGGDSGGDDADSEPSPDAAKDKAPKSASDPGGQVSMRQSMAQLLGDENDRTSFEKWSNGYNSDADFAKAATQMRGAFDQRVAIPGADAKPEDIDKFYQRIGKPAASKDYDFDFGKTESGDALKLSDTEAARYEQFKDIAHKANLTKAQFQELVRWNQDDNVRSEEATLAFMDSFQNETIASLRKEWGPDFDNNLEMSRQVSEFADDQEEWKQFVNLRMAGGMAIGDHPTFIKTMAKIGRLNAEDVRARNLRNSGEAQDIQAKILEIEAEASRAGKSTSSPEYHKRLEPLYARLHPGKISV